MHKKLGLCLIIGVLLTCTVLVALDQSHPHKDSNPDSTLNPTPSPPRFSLLVEQWNFSDGFAVQATNIYSFTLYRVQVTILFDDGHKWQDYHAYLPSYNVTLGVGRVFYTFRYDIHTSSGDNWYTGEQFISAEAYGYTE